MEDTRKKTKTTSTDKSIMGLGSLTTCILSLTATVAIYAPAPLTSRYYYSYLHEVLALKDIDCGLYVGFGIYEFLHSAYLFQASVFPILLICAYSSQTAKQIELLKSNEDHPDIRTYIEIELMNIHFQDCFSSHILPLIHATICTSICFNSFTIIGFHKRLPYPHLFVFGFTAMSMTIAVFFTFPIESSISTDSKAYLNVLKRGCFGNRKSKYEKAVIRSLRPLRIQIGGFFYLTRASTLVALSLLLFYTLKLVILSRK
jgi:hypothetical protein